MRALQPSPRPMLHPALLRSAVAPPRAEPHAAPVRDQGGRMGALRRPAPSLTPLLSPPSAPAPRNSTAASASPRFARPRRCRGGLLRSASPALRPLTGAPGRPRSKPGKRGRREEREEGGRAPTLLPFLSPPPSSLQAKLRRYGLAGVLAYGILNTAWYAVAFVSAWRVGAGSPTSLGARAALAKGAEVLAYAWAGSQVTKVARLAAAVALAPVADRVLGGVQTAAGLRTKRAAFGVAVAGLCAVATIVLVGTVGTAV